MTACDPDGDWIFGIHAVTSALESGRPVAVVHRAREARDRRLTEVVRLARDRGVEVVRVPRSRLDALARGRHQGIAARVSPVGLLDLDALLAATADRGGRRLLLALDRVTDEGNAGALIRSAAVLGADAVLLGGKGGARPGAGLARTSSGTLDRIPLGVAARLPEALRALAGTGFRILGAVVEGGEPPGASDRAGDRVLVLGSESRGLSPAVVELLDRRLTIPTRDGMPSLNVAAAGAILLAWAGGAITGAEKA